MEQLNPEQRTASLHGTGPMLVLAGPGCGKTTALVARYANLLDAGVKPEQILAITFTRKAARNMQRRICKDTGVARERTVIGTFHSAALAIMRTYPQAFGELAERRVLSEQEPERLISEIAADLEMSSDGMSDVIERFKDELITPGEALKAARGREGPDRYEAERRGKLYARYQKRLAAEGALDFGDILFAVVSTLEADEKLLRTLRKRYRFVMVDEYQDINPAQDRMLKLISGPDNNIWAVGDPQQAIYGFRGSHIEYILTFAERNPRARTVQLFRNYRSSQTILKAAAAVLVKAKSGGTSDMQLSGRQKGGPLELHEAADPASEAEWIARRIQHLIRQGTPENEIAVLVRVAHHAGFVERALAGLDIAYSLLGLSNFWTQPEVRQALRVMAAVSELAAPDDIPPPKRIMDEITSKDRARSFAELGARVCQLVSRNPRRDVTGQRREAWQAAMSILAAEFRSAGTADELARRAAARRAPTRSGSDTGNQDASGERGGDSGGAGVQIGTIHSAKGLEYDAVFVAACEDGVMPHAKADDHDEERRLAFVAITRARHLVAMTWTRERGRHQVVRSPYIAEIRSHLSAQDIRETADRTG